MNPENLGKRTIIFKEECWSGMEYLGFDFLFVIHGKTEIAEV